MPGIAGMIGSRCMKEGEHAVREMIQTMMHEPFYTSAMWVDERLRVSVGWVGHRGSFADCMPVWNEMRDICLMFTGEDFTEAERLHELKARGHCFQSDNATYLVHLYEEEGLSFLERLNGWFSGVLIDRRKSTAVLFNDRYGLQRLYYHATSIGFFFASEAKALLKVLPKLRAIDASALAETFSFGCVLGNRTLFPGVALVPGASKWTFADGAVNKQRYFEMGTWESQPPLNEAQYCERLQDVFTQVLPKYLRGPARLGMSLTAGLDGRMIMAWARSAPDTLPCYTFGSEFRESADVKIARRVARLCGQPHATITVDQRFLAEFPMFAEKTVYYTDGVMDVSGAVELYVNKLVREIAPVRLTGNYGSEILRRHVAFRPRPFDSQPLTHEFSELVRQAARTYSMEREGNDLSFVAFRQVPWHHYSRFAVEQSQVVIRSPYLDNELVALAYRVPATLVQSPAPLLRLIATGKQCLAQVPTDRGLSASSGSVRRQLLQAYQQVTMKVEYAYDYGMPSWLARIDSFLKPLHIERVLLGRHKFYHFRPWYRDRLLDYVKDVLLDPAARRRSYINAEGLKRMIDDHGKGKRNFAGEIHRLLTAELLHRKLVLDATA